MPKKTSIPAPGNPDRIGLKDGSLTSCPSSPNCVSSQSSDAKHYIDPLKYSISWVEANGRLTGLIESLPKVRTISEEDEYLHYEFSTPLWGFKDDVEFYLPRMEKVIHFRSASRVGWYDFGMNRKRLESIRRLFEASPDHRS